MIRNYIAAYVNQNLGDETVKSILKRLYHDMVIVGREIHLLPHQLATKLLDYGVMMLHRINFKKFDLFQCEEAAFRALDSYFAEERNLDLSRDPVLSDCVDRISGNYHGSPFLFEDFVMRLFQLLIPKGFPVTSSKLFQKLAEEDDTLACYCCEVRVFFFFLIFNF